MRIGVPVALDPGAFPPSEVDARIELALPRVAVHAGWERPFDSEAVHAHPEDLRHSTPFLNFPNQTITPAPSHREPLTCQPGEARRFRFRVYFHSGDVRGGNVERECKASITPVRAQIGVPVRLA